MDNLNKQYTSIAEYIESVRHILTSHGVSDEDIKRVVDTPNKNIIEKFLDECIKHGEEVKAIAEGISNML